jgi:MFS family permease
MIARATGRGRSPLPRPFWFLFYGMIINRIGAFLLPFLTLYLTGKGLSPAQAGLILAAYGVGTTTSAIAGGTLADRWGRRPTMVCSLMATAALTAPMGFVSAPLVLAALAIALGLTANVYRPAANAAVADLVPRQERVRAFGLLYWAENLGFSAAAIAGGVIASHSFAALFLTDAVTSAGFAVVIMRGLRGTRVPTPAASGSAPGAGLTAVMRDGVFMAFVLLAFAFMWIYFQTSVGLPVSLLRAGLSPGRYGLILAANGVTVVACQPAVSLLIRRMEKGHALAAAAVLLGAGFGMFAWVHTLPLFATAVVVWTLGEIVYSTTAPALVADLAPEALRGRYQGVWGASVGAAAIAGPGMGGLLIGTLGVAWLWHACLGLGLLVAAWHWALAGSYRRGTRATVHVAAHAASS